MKIIRRAQNLEQTLATPYGEKGCVLTIGNFDGVHIGHREIIKLARQQASKKGTKFVAMTFEPHPVAILRPDKVPQVLTPLLLKQHLLAECGVDALIVLRDTHELLRLSAEDFFFEFLVKKVRPSVVVEGEDFNFGAGRTGNVNMLSQIGARKGIEVLEVPLKKVQLAGGQMVRASSTTIRYMLESGHVAEARILLGRAYRLAGKIVPGKGRGKELGFPTLNMDRSTKQVIPTEGVYAGLVEIAESEEEACKVGAQKMAVFSIGQARTFGDEHPLLIEAHLLDGAGNNCFGKWMAMDFVQHIRRQHKFKSGRELSAQIAKDCERAKEILAMNEH
ncbi:MAG: bifunctional riboflavin kinase/FAD synthetase [Sedimentisphaerales bacterium]|nr:bifunctional riboflavin kinase/FAD synthetase [Sedimentisphaerales bacterium]